MEFTLSAICDNELGCGPANCGNKIYQSLRDANEAALVMHDIDDLNGLNILATDILTDKTYPVGIPKGSTVVVINKQHQILPEQQNILIEQYKKYYELKVPTEGWVKEEMIEVRQLFSNQNVVFISPVPWLLMECAFWYSHGYYDISVGGDPRAPYGCKVFCNDTREKKELPNGKVISVTAKTGWYLA